MRGYYHIYAKTTCEYCKLAIDLLKERGEKFVVTVMDNCQEYEDGAKQMYAHPTVPIVLKLIPKEGGPSAELIGGYTELERLLSNE